MTASSREAQLAEAFIGIADTLVSDYDVVDVLQTLVERAAHILDAVDAGILLPDSEGTLGVVAATSGRSELVSILQLKADEGPCVDAYARKETIVVENIAATYSQWPLFATAAATVEYQSMYAIPMRLRDETIGSLNLFSDRPGPIDPVDTAAARALADIATIGILQERAIREAGIAQEQLQRALTSRILIEQAKGVLSQSERLDMDSAFTVLRSRARHSGRRLTDVAHEIIKSAASQPE